MTRRLLNGLVLVALLVVAGFVIHTTPTDAQRDAPIVVSGAIGSPLSGRNIAVTVHEVHLADVVSTASWQGETEGVWVVVDASAAAVETENGALLNAALVIGDRTFSASGRPGLDTIADQSLAVGIPITGPIMFEVPVDAANGRAELRFAQNGDPRADSVLAVAVDLSGLELEEMLTASEISRGGS